MGFILRSLAFETTRKCNLKCGHCMRGPSQNVNLSPEVIDNFFQKNNIEQIGMLMFSGGEPTLNPKIIVYTIDKIINENINICKVGMATNGQIFNKEIVEAFNKFEKYRNTMLKKGINEYKFYNEQRETLTKNNTDNHAKIRFSTDRFHKEITDEIKKEYQTHAKNLQITEYDLSDEYIIKTGFSSLGKKFIYQLDNLIYYQEKQNYYIVDNMYITSNGYITNEGMGQYSDMDNINMGHVSDTTIREILYKYGTPIFNTEPISFSPKLLKKKI